ncbi:MAG: hypothetical protein GWN45_02085, partial [Gammaproteobacteria bacterium]|nr:hypothetical protein [Gammaproteobacteria bacterium]
WTPGIQGHTSNVYRGTIVSGQPFAYNHDCFSAEHPIVQAEDETLPPSGTAFYYLISADNACGESRIGVDSELNDIFADPGCGSFGRDVDGDSVPDVE